MRIIKYIFLLILLFAVALTVYVATQNGYFDISKSKVINVPQANLFHYINDYKNWEDWGPWSEEDTLITYQYNTNTRGLGASYSWNGKNGKGKMTTVQVIENDSIFQKITFKDDSPNDIIWGFQKIDNNSTKLTWRMKGKMSFMMKIVALTKGGTENLLGPMFEKGLENIDNILVKELKTYTINVEGLVMKSGINYIKQSITCKSTSLAKNTGILTQRLDKFTKDNNLTVTGSPFVMFEKHSRHDSIVRFSVCLPIEQEIFTSEGSDTEGGKLDSYLALKTILKGDYSHSKEAWEKAYKTISKKRWKENSIGKYIEVYQIGPKQTRKPSRWVTEIYIPILQKITPVQAIPPIVVDSTKV